MLERTPLKVLYILPPTKTFAGIERVVDEICDQLARQMSHRVDVDVLFTAEYGTSTAQRRHYRKIFRRIDGRMDLIRTFRTVVGARPYDLVVVPQVEPTVVAWLACIGLGRRFVLHLHGNPRLEVRSWKARLLFLLMDRLVLHRLAAVFGTSRTQLDAFQQLYPSSVPHFWVPNPIRRFAMPSGGPANPADAPAAAGGPVTYVKVGRFSFQKGQDLLIRAFAKAHAARPRTRLVLVGYGSEEESLRAQIRSLGLNDAVRLAYHPDDPQVPLSASDIYVSASRWEGWSLAICEALRFGLPVIATDCEFGPRDILTDRRLGQLVPSEDEDALAAAMIAFHDALDREKSHAAFRIAYVDRFSAETVVHNHAEALEQSGRGHRTLQPATMPRSARVH